jgi:hypothetical protein
MILARASISPKRLAANKNISSLMFSGFVPASMVTASTGIRSRIRIATINQKPGA